VTSDGHAAGRGGPGAVLGAKRLKGVAVRGEIPVPIADPARFERARADLLRLFRASPPLFGEFGFRRHGTAALVDLADRLGITPAENFRRSRFEGSARYNAAAVRARFGEAPLAAGDCLLGCRRRGAGGRPLPGYGTLSCFGALNGIDDLGAIADAAASCAELWLDTISAAATLAAWGEARGRFAAAGELGGLLRDAALRRGTGDLLAQGSRRLARALGRPELSMTVKGLELTAYDPRGALGSALACAVSVRGGGDPPAYTLGPELLRRPAAVDRLSLDGKAWLVKAAEDAEAALDALGACRFALLGAGLEEYAELLSAATGREFDAAALAAAGERIVLAGRLYNAASGFGPEDDTLPARFFEEAAPGRDGSVLQPIDSARFAQERERYYRLRRLSAQGVPLDGERLAREP